MGMSPSEIASTARLKKFTDKAEARDKAVASALHVILDEHPKDPKLAARMKEILEHYSEVSRTMKMINIELELNKSAIGNLRERVRKRVMSADIKKDITETIKLLEGILPK